MAIQSEGGFGFRKARGLENELGQARAMRRCWRSISIPARHALPMGTPGISILRSRNSPVISCTVNPSAQRPSNSAESGVSWRTSAEPAGTLRTGELHRLTW